MDGGSAAGQVGLGDSGDTLGTATRKGWNLEADQAGAPLFLSYEYMRRSLIFYRNEIRKMTGKVCAGRTVAGPSWGGPSHLTLRPS